MLIVSPCRATTGSNHIVDVPLLDWLAVLTLSRARMVRRQVRRTARAGPPSTKFYSFRVMMLNDVGVIRHSVLGEIMIVVNISLGASWIWV